MTAPRVAVTVVIAARDEGDEIAPCIRSVGWAAEVIVVENDSRDDTVERAREAGAIVLSPPFTSIGAQRNVAIARATQDWVLVVDADERATEALGDEIARVTAVGAGPGAYRLRRRNFFLGREIRHGGWERDRPVRLFRRSLRYDERPVHEHVTVDGAVGTLREPLLHTPYASLDEYFDKLRRYSRWWATQSASRGRRASMADIALRPLGKFVGALLLRGGWRDGAHGVVLAALGAMSVAAKYAQLWALDRASQGAGRVAEGSDAGDTREAAMARGDSPRGGDPAASRSTLGGPGAPPHEAS